MPKKPIRKRFCRPKSKSKGAKPKNKTTAPNEGHGQCTGQVQVGNPGAVSSHSGPSSAVPCVTKGKEPSREPQQKKRSRVTFAETHIVIDDLESGRAVPRGGTVGGWRLDKVRELEVRIRVASVLGPTPTPTSAPDANKERELDSGSEDSSEAEENGGVEIIETEDSSSSNEPAPLTFEQRMTNQLLRNKKSSSFFQAAIPFSAQEVQMGLTFLQTLHQSQGKKLHVIRTAQQFLLLQSPGQRQGRPPGLVIGVDATPDKYAGYCVNLQEKTLEYYIVDGADIPWEIREKSASHEFEMKNLLFALSLWNEQIQKLKSVSIFTDNNTILQKAPGKNRNYYGVQVNKLIEHFVQCKSVRVINSSSLYVNSSVVGGLTSFAKYIQPADDLSRGKNQSCLSFLQKLYLIEEGKVKGAYQTSAGTATTFYQKALDKAKEFASSFNCDEHREDLATDLKVPTKKRKRTRRSGSSQKSRKKRKRS